jgi:hypothetical protein
MGFDLPRPPAPAPPTIQGFTALDIQAAVANVLTAAVAAMLLLAFAAVGVRELRRAGSAARMRFRNAADDQADRAASLAADMDRRARVAREAVQVVAPLQDWLAKRRVGGGENDGGDDDSGGGGGRAGETTFQRDARDGHLDARAAAIRAEGRGMWQARR